jgi:hypothetical protein
MKNSIIPAIILIILSGLISFAVLATVDESDKQVAVLFPLHNSFIENFSLANESGVRVIRSGFGDHILIVEKLSDTNIKNLYNAGAIAVFNPLVVGQCFTKPPTSKQLSSS